MILWHFNQKDFFGRKLMLPIFPPPQVSDTRIFIVSNVIIFLAYTFIILDFQVAIYFYCC